MPAEKASGEGTVWKYLGCGCLTIIVVAILAIGGCSLWVRNLTEKTLSQFTAETSQELPSVEMPDDEVEDLKRRINQFVTSVEQSTGKELIMTPDEINAWINLTEMVPLLKDRAFVGIEGDAITAQVSLPLTFLEDVPFLSTVKDRFFNGNIALRVQMVGKDPAAFIENLSVNGVSPPDEVLREFKRQNLFDEARRRGQQIDLGELESIVVEEGVIKIRARGPKDGDEEEGETDSETEDFEVELN